MAVYLIGGPPKCGKTTLAKALSKKLLVPWISSDTLENIVRVYTQKEQHPLLFPHSYVRGKSNDKFYAYHTPEAIVQGYVEQSKATYDAVSMIVETYLTDQDDFIVEGYQVTPEIVYRILKKFGDEHIRAVFLLRRDEGRMVQDFHKSTTPNDWILRKTKEEATFAKIAKMISVYADYTEKEAKKYKLPVFEMDTNFSISLEKVIQQLLFG